MALAALVLKKLARKIAPKDWKLPSTSYAFRDIREEARKVHLVLEVRDARIPFTSANLQLQQILKWKQHMVVFTKVDLADHSMLNEWKKYFSGQHYLFVNGHSKRSVKRMMKTVRARLVEAGAMDKVKVVMLVGLPNVGKTVLANTMHRVGRFHVSELQKLTLGEIGMDPYLTKRIASYKINYTPPMYVMDTPSVMHTRIHDLETGFKLALTGAISDRIVGSVRLARYLLAILNHQPSSFLSRWKAQYLAHKFLSAPRDPTIKADRKKMGADDRQLEVQGLIASRLLSFDRNLEDAYDMERLVEAQFTDVHNLYQAVSIRNKVSEGKVARRILSLYRVGKLGFFTWDALPQPKRVPKQGSA